ncbi:MAG TPA: copper homeostasis membrane protein CopD [Micropepsaceae bacterium]|jgi:putative copper resistance protein D
MTVAAGLIASRFVHYAALMILFGVAAFPVYAYYAKAPSAFEAEAFFPWSRRVQIVSVLAALVSGILWLGFVAATMSGQPAALFDANILWQVISTTDFGRVWAPRLGLTGVALILLLPKNPPETLRLTVLGCAAIALTSIADTGHAGADNGPRAALHITADAVHLSAAGVWVGALFILARFALIARRLEDRDLRIFDHALTRFSGVGPVVVGALTLSGILNPGFLASLETTYGQVLLAKLVLFGAMLLLAAANRFRLAPRLQFALASGIGSESATRALRTSVLAETVLSLLVLAAVAWLGTLAPPA